MQYVCSTFFRDSKTKRYHTLTFLYPSSYAKKMLVGIDEAGRGPVIGPLVVCAAAVSDNNRATLESLNLKDSKMYSRTQRELLKESILSVTECRCVELSASDLAAKMRDQTLNDIEVDLFVEALSFFSQVTSVIVDACDVNEARFGEKICARGNISSVISKHKADVNYPIVSAASIIAKLQRDKRIETLKKVYGDFGSGYASDKKTITFLREYIKEKGKLPSIARSSWDTSKRLLEEHYQCSLNSFR